MATQDGTACPGPGEHPLFAALHEPLGRRLEERCCAPSGAELVATEPAPHMLGRARRRAAALGLAVEFHNAHAEAPRFPDASNDAVVCAPVLSTVGAGPRCRDDFPPRRRE